MNIGPLYTQDLCDGEVSGLTKQRSRMRGDCRYEQCTENVGMERCKYGLNWWERKDTWDYWPWMPECRRKTSTTDGVEIATIRCPVFLSFKIGKIDTKETLSVHCCIVSFRRKQRYWSVATSEIYKALLNSVLVVNISAVYCRNWLMHWWYTTPRSNMWRCPGTDCHRMEKQLNEEYHAYGDAD